MERSPAAAHLRTTLGLLKSWKTSYHRQVTAIGLAPTPAGTVAGLADGIPAVAVERVGTRRSIPTLARQYDRTAAAPGRGGPT